jgi:LemA protein
VAEAPGEAGEEDGMRAMIATVMLAAALSGCGYNKMVALREAIEAAWAQVENQMQRRNDLIPNLVEVTKGYAAHERGVFESIANARARLLASGSREERMEASNDLSGAVGRLLALAERYPELKANEQFARLSDELAGTENRIAVERMRYNEAVRAYNTYLQSFPAVLYAKALGFTPVKYFEAPKEAQQVPKVDFGTPPPTGP